MKVAVLNAGLANQEYIFGWFFLKNGTVGPSGLNQVFIFMWITHFLLIQVQARALTWGGKRVGNATSTSLFKWCVMQSRTGTSGFRASGALKGWKNFPFLCNPIWSQLIPIDPNLIPVYCVTPFCACSNHPTLRIFICPAVTCGRCASMQSGTCQSSPHNVHCQWTFGAQQTINHVVHDAGKKSHDVNMPFGCCNCGWWTDIGTCAANVWAHLTNFLMVFSLVPWRR